VKVKGHFQHMLKASSHYMIQTVNADSMTGFHTELYNL